MTIARLAIEGEYKENCLFAGFSIYQNLREDIRFCSNRSFWNGNKTDRTTGTKHTISPSDDMILVIYAIKYYTSIVTTLICQLVMVLQLILVSMTSTVLGTIACHHSANHILTALQLPRQSLNLRFKIDL